MRVSTLATDFVSVGFLLACLTGVWAIPGAEDHLSQYNSSPNEDANKIDYELFGGPEPNRGAYDYPTPTYGGYGYPPTPPLSTPKVSSSLSSVQPSLNITSSGALSTALTSGPVSGFTASSGILTKPKICENACLPMFSLVRIKLGKPVSHIGHGVIAINDYPIRLSDFV
ncbi:hypothetical protein F4818DRAFT_444965 [Hypoxylon cercidicola]|nr:hypothetical protein F4818DRAFT_444965 [Hypoxylon cercidicola]